MLLWRFVFVSEAELTLEAGVKFGKDPMLQADNSYEILRAISKALAASDGDDLKALKSVRYEGVGGLVDFTRSMFANFGEGHLYRVSNGGFELMQ